MNKITLLINVSTDDRTAEMSIIASNELISQIQVTLLEIRTPLHNKSSYLWVKHGIADGIPEFGTVREAVLSVTDDRRHGADRKQTFRQRVAANVVDDV